uniref:Secreted protein n=1 Tax=Lotus japonicus TaxID=34305 RepID=I3S8A3_LOTJA|nr:unknown [Lotus japonicus]
MTSVGYIIFLLFSLCGWPRCNLNCLLFSIKVTSLHLVKSHVEFIVIGMQKGGAGQEWGRSHRDPNLTFAPLVLKHNKTPKSIFLSSKK